MKSILVILAALTVQSAFASAGPNFSAFVIGDSLFVTVMGDSCNGIGGDLKVDPTCRSDRSFKNLAPVCNIELELATTEMACGDDKSVPQVVEFSLSQSKVAPEALALYLKLGGQTICVQTTAEKACR